MESNRKYELEFILDLFLSGFEGFRIETLDNLADEEEEYICIPLKKNAIERSERGNYYTRFKVYSINPMLYQGKNRSHVVIYEKPDGTYSEYADLHNKFKHIGYLRKTKSKNTTSFNAKRNAFSTMKDLRNGTKGVNPHKKTIFNM